jgi:hypothetical protein
MISFLTGRLKPYFSDTRFSEILRGSIWALAARLLAAMLTLVVGVVVARGYGAGAMGVLATVQSYLALATIFTVSARTRPSCASSPSTWAPTRSPRPRVYRKRNTS